MAWPSLFLSFNLFTVWRTRITLLLVPSLSLNFYRPSQRVRPSSARYGQENVPFSIVRSSSRILVLWKVWNLVQTSARFQVSLMNSIFRDSSVNNSFTLAISPIHISVLQQTPLSLMILDRADLESDSMTIWFPKPKFIFNFRDRFLALSITWDMDLTSVL